VVSNTFIFAKLVHQPNYASRKPPLGEDKKGYWKSFMVWFGYLYKIDRRQLVMSHLALTNVELKTKSLVLRANLFKKVEDIFVEREDFLFVERNNN
jgi:hypothetical protein